MLAEFSFNISVLERLVFDNFTSPTMLCRYVIDLPLIQCDTPYSVTYEPGQGSLLNKREYVESTIN